MLRIFGGFAVVALVGLAANEVKAAEYQLTGENTKIEFVGTKPDGKHAGSFPKLSGVFQLDKEIHRSKISVIIDVEALESDDPKLTAHLKSPDFFETKKFPEAKFVSKSIKAEKGSYLITGELMMHGKAKEITFPAEIEHKDGVAILTSEFSINRSEWGLNYMPGKIDEAVKMKIKVHAK